MRGTCFSLTVCQPVFFKKKKNHIPVAGKTTFIFLLLKSHLRSVLLGVVNCLIKNYVRGLWFSLLALI